MSMVLGGAPPWAVQPGQAWHAAHAGVKAQSLGPMFNARLNLLRPADGPMAFA
jgi:hypothetical protein